MASDHYQTLGVDRQATPDEIKRAYRRLARELHPDANPDDPAAESRFKEVARAYEVLSDPERRRRYDVLGTDEDQGPGFGPGFGGLGDIFDAFFGGGVDFGGGRSRPAGPPRGSDLESTVELELGDTITGTQAPVTVRTAVACVDCGASGAAPGTYPSPCPDCGGTGQVRRVRQSILGQMVSAGPCPRCNTLGSIIDTPCPSCRGEGRRVEDKTYTVDIPAGIDDGQTLRLAGRGAIGPRGGQPGDLYVHVRVLRDDRFERHGNDLVHELHISPFQAALGTEFDLETFDGPQHVTVDRGTQHGDLLRLRGMGVPQVGTKRRGDLVVVVVVVTPTELTDEEEDLLRQLASLRGEIVSEPQEGFFSRLRSAFK
ncbi:MAG: J domain-containing protein [Acidimicrobiales bacterium]|jgi:molecular chaperone DnaJ|nr:J domain-containing protein [Acidimicrobiales bacterium]